MYIFRMKMQQYNLKARLSSKTRKRFLKSNSTIKILNLDFRYVILLKIQTLDPQLCRQKTIQKPTKNELLTTYDYALLTHVLLSTYLSLQSIWKFLFCFGIFDQMWWSDDATAVCISHFKQIFGRKWSKNFNFIYLFHFGRLSGKIQNIFSHENRVVFTFVAIQEVNCWVIWELT